MFSLPLFLLVSRLFSFPMPPPSIPSMPLFFFESSAATRDLHSFPTRRSSDLPRGGAPRSAGGEGARAGEAARRPIPQRGRSEEHTSELQSPYDLVCRLLLEKKNNRWSVRARCPVVLYTHHCANDLPLGRAGTS